MHAMLRALGVLAIALLVVPAAAKAGNTDDVIAGNDVALTGGAVVANVHTGGAMWFNPAGVARLDSRAVDLTGAVLSYSIVSAPGSLSVQSGEQSAGDYSALQAIPRALTFVASPRPELRWGIGFFYSRSLSRFLQDTVSAPADSTEPSEFYATSDETNSLYHLSSAVAWKKSERFLLGGGLDIVIASRRFTEIVSGAYGGGAGGTFNRNFNQSIAGGGLQMKAGLQFAPIEQVRIGWMAATPSYLVYLDNETTVTESLSPPAGPPQFSGSQIDDVSGSWAGVEPGLTGFGVAYVRPWGWVEGDVIVRFPLRTPELGIDWNTRANVRVGGIFRITERLKLGGGFFTDFSPESDPSQFGDSKINFYGFTLGVDFANRPEPPERGQDGFYIAFAVAFRYAHGKGTLAGLSFPSAFPTPSSQPGQLDMVGITLNELGINLAVKAAF